MPITLVKPKPVESVQKAGKAVMKGATAGAVKKAVKRLPKKLPRKGKMKMKKLKPIAKKAIKKASPPGALFNAQRAKYEKAMNSAMKKGGSNGVGVGY